MSGTNEEYPIALNPFDDEEELVDEKVDISTASLNPFDNEEDDDKIFQTPSPKPAPRRKKRSISVGGIDPFKEDSNKSIDETEQNTPEPKPTFFKTSGDSVDEGSVKNSSRFRSLSLSPSSYCSNRTRKKKPAPKPPSLFSGTESEHSSLTPSPSVTQPQRVTPKLQKVKEAPLPPTSTPSSI